MLIISLPKPDIIRSVVVEVRKVSFSAPNFRNMSSAEEPNSNYAYRNLLAIRQVFLIALSPWYFYSSPQFEFLAKSIEEIHNFILENIRFIRNPRFVLGLANFKVPYKFPDEMDELMDEFDSPEARLQFHKVFKFYQKRWNDEFIPFILNFQVFRALNDSFNTDLKRLYGRIDNCFCITDIIRVPQILRSKAFIGPNFDHLTSDEIRIAIERIESATRCDESSCKIPLQPSFPLADRQRLDYLVAWFNIISCNSPILSTCPDI
jgi:hypothetical protein